MVKRVLLVGFMGSGKSTVGPLLARRLDWDFADFDAEVERRAGCSVAEIFATRGEAHFRHLESEAGRELLRRERVVLASGGGWAAAEGRLEGLPPDTVSVWLRVDAETAVRRAGEHGATRPLLADPDPVARARSLLSEREDRYALAHLHVDTAGRTPVDVATTIAAALESEPAIENPHTSSN